MSWLSLFGLLAVVVLFAFLVVRDRKELAAGAGDHAQEQALVLADHAARLFEATELALSTIIDDTQHLNWAAIQHSASVWRRMRRLADRLPYVEAFWLNDSSGRLQMTSLAFPAPDLDASARDYFLVHATTPHSGVHVSERTDSNGGGTFRLSRRVDSPDGSFRGVASLTVDTQYFHAFYSGLSLPPGSTVTLLRRGDLHPLLQQRVGGGVQPIALHDVEHLRKALEEDPVSGRFRAPSPLDGLERVYAYREVPGLPLLVKVSIPLDSLRDKWIARVASRLAMATLALSAWGGLTALGLRELGRHRRFQEELAERVARRTAQLAEANAQLETLVHEVHHRVNNNLQIIGTLLSMQSAEVADPHVRAAMAQSTGRVHTISLLYQTLYGTGAMVDLAFGDYLAALGRQTSDLYGLSQVRIAVEGANPRLHLDVAVPLALVVHEVLSDVLAHAFRDELVGKVRIELSEEAQEWRLAISGDCIGRWDRGGGVGIRIIQALATQIAGEARFTPDPNTHFALTWPRQP